MWIVSALTCPRLASRRRILPAPRRLRGASIECLEDRTLFANFAPTDVFGLIAAINSANKTPEADTITLPARAMFTLTAVNNAADGGNGLPVIAAGEELTIVGNGAVIARSLAGKRPTFRLIDVAAGASLTLQNVTLQGGVSLAIWYLPVPAQGGAVRSQGALTMTGVTVRNNTARGQGLSIGLWGATVEGGSGTGGGVWSDGTLTIAGCTIAGNLASGGLGRDGYFYQIDMGDFVDGSPGGYALGGGVYVAGGAATVSNSTFTANVARGGGGGAGYASERGSAGGAGGAASGGALYVATGTLTLHTVRATANHAAGGAGGAPGLAHPKGAAGTGLGGGALYRPRGVGRTGPLHRPERHRQRRLLQAQKHLRVVRENYLAVRGGPPRQSLNPLFERGGNPGLIRSPAGAP